MGMVRWMMFIVALSALMVGSAAWFGLGVLSDIGDEFSAGPSDYGLPERVGTLEWPAIRESSGLIASRLHPGLLWTHNDSGDSARLFLMDEVGKHRGEFHIENARNIDWEDIAHVWVDGRSMLLVGDIGDNNSRRTHVTLYLVPEPAELPADVNRPVTLRHEGSIRFRYEDGPRDAESLAFDPLHGMILIVDKPWMKRRAPSNRTPTGLYVLPWPDDFSGEPIFTATRAADLPMGLPTAMDMSPDLRRLIIMTYGDAFEYHRDKHQTWPEVVKIDEPRQVAMPLRQQGEAIAFSLDGRSLWTTTEQRNSPLWRINRLDDNSR